MVEVRVRPGDTLSHYARLFMIPLELLTDSNENINPARMYTAEKVKIPGFISVPYKIKQDETLWKIAYSRNIPLDSILLLNQKENPNELVVDEVIYLPERITHPITFGKLPFGSRIISKQINLLRRNFPFITTSIIGKSVLGNPIEEIRIGKGKKKVHMNGSFHANEWITSMILMNLVTNYLLALTNRSMIDRYNLLQFYNDVELSIVPMVNPDGVDLVLNGPPPNLREELIAMNNGSNEFVHWKANIRGVDLNNQYPAKWEIEQQRKIPKSPAPRDFPGTNYLTEPEAVAMAELVKNNHFDRVLAFHTQGEEFYWGYEGYEPPESERIAEEFERVSGYKAIRNVDSHAGFKDWYIQEYHLPGFTIELGRGINPLPLSQYQHILKKVEGIFLAALYL